MLSAYYRLTKPGIIYGNSLTAIAAFFLASKDVFHPGLFVAMLAGVALSIAAGCVLNNLLDRGIDELMPRTQNRRQILNQTGTRNAVIFAVILAAVGLAILFWFTNTLTMLVVLSGILLYVGVYTPLKVRTLHAATIGTLPGAVSILAGFTAVTGRIGWEGLILFLIMVIWQLPHFYAIAIYRLRDYQAAHVPVLPAEKGIRYTKLSIIVLIVLYLVSASMLYVFRFVGWRYLAVVGILGLYWLAMAFRGLNTPDTGLWARRMYRFSLILLLVFSIMIGVS
ncbi:MAG TPA: heme o synthase [Patescibacteria group bacterium]|nr:heme o synthase [Patescibacteria group bacterium]